MANPRVYYAIQAVGFAPIGTELLAVVSGATSSGYKAAKGVQSVGSNVNFNTDKVQELGQLAVYEIFENVPQVEATVSKIIDGYSLLGHLASPGATSNTLSGRYGGNTKCMMAIAYFPIAADNATGTPLTAVLMSGMYVSALNWDIPIQGNITESITLVGNDRYWINTSGQTFSWATGTKFGGDDAPIAASGGTQRRQNVRMGNSTTSSLWPTDIRGINVSGHNIAQADGSYASHIQNVKISTSLGRTEIFELGTKTPFFRYAEFPLSVTCSIDVHSDERNDFVNAYSNATNLSNRTIKIYLDQMVILDLGTRNLLTSVSQSGGDTGGGNVLVTYNYTNFNDLTITSIAAS